MINLGTSSLATTLFTIGSWLSVTQIQTLQVVAFTSLSHQHHGLLQQNNKQTVMRAAKSICTFDKEDFALPTGEWPYVDSDMGRLDPTDDSNFYDAPRFVTHIDDFAIQSLTSYYKDEITAIYEKNGGERKVDILDLCSSWISHYPVELEDKLGLTVGIGMNEEELAANKQLFMHYTQNLNVNPSLSQFEDNSFDIVTNVVSVDYLTKPKEIFEEMHRVLRPGGIALMSFSNRCFPSKAVAMWLQADDIERLTIVASYFHYSAEWSSIEALDAKLAPIATPDRPSFGDIMSNPSKAFAWANTATAVAKMNSGDPLFIVKGTK
jgi:hypothetical protein